MLLKVSPNHPPGAAEDPVSNIFANLGKCGFPSAQVEPQFNNGPSISFAPATVDANGIVIKMSFILLVIQMAMPAGEEGLLNVGHRRWHMFDRRTDDQSTGWYSSILSPSEKVAPSVCTEGFQWVTARMTAEMRYVVSFFRIIFTCCYYVPHSPVLFFNLLWAAVCLSRMVLYCKPCAVRCLLQLRSLVDGVPIQGGTSGRGLVLVLIGYRM
jgi:hypothetical protein